MKKPKTFVPLLAIELVAMWYALRLSASGRGPVDYVVLAVIGGWVVWTVWGLARRLWAGGGMRALSHLARTTTFWLVGLMNTAWAREADAATWRWPAGIALLVLATIDSIALAVREAQIRGKE